MQIARIYLRVSSPQQSLLRQAAIIDEARAAGYYVAGVYKEKASGASLNRPELSRLISDLQPGDVIIAEQIDRISRLPLGEAEELIRVIRRTGARLCVPGVVDLSQIASGQSGMAKIVLEAMQELLLKIALQMSREDYEGRRERQRQGIEAALKVPGKYAGKIPNKKRNEQIVIFRKSGQTIARTAELVGCSVSQVKQVWARHKATCP
jgi:DNA invertase Pin-like site-specific DNA recombinase